MKKDSKRKILVGFGEVAGYFSNLYDGFIALDQDAGYINNINFKFNYEFNRVKNHKFLNKYIDFCKNYRRKPTFLKKIVYHFFSLLIVFFIIVRYDVFVLGCNSTLLGYWDYRLLKFFNKKIIYISLGSDSRPPYLNGNYKDDLLDFDVEKVLKETKNISRKVKFFEKYADVFINYPQHAHFHSLPFVNGMNIGFPTKQVSNDYNKKNNSSIRVLHAPSRPNAKGSIFFQQIISELISEGISIEYVELKNKTNQEVLAEIKQSDIVLDEQFSDLPLGGLGAEAAMFGVPVLVGGYYSSIIRNETNPELIAPSMYVHPDEIKSNLKQLCINHELRKTVGKNLLSFISNQWHFALVAQRFINLIDGKIDPSWVFNPQDLKYLNGWGLSALELKTNISKIVNQKGAWNNLHLSNYLLVQKFKRLISND